MDYHEKYVKYKKKYLHSKKKYLHSKKKSPHYGITIHSKKYSNKLTANLIEDVLNSFFDFEWTLLGIQYQHNGQTWNIFDSSSKKQPFWTESLSKEFYQLDHFIPDISVVDTHI